MRNCGILLLASFFISCSNESSESDIPLTASKIVGTWQLISNSCSIGGPVITEEIDNGGIYKFDLDNTF